MNVIKIYDNDIMDYSGFPDLKKWNKLVKTKLAEHFLKKAIDRL